MPPVSRYENGSGSSDAPYRIIFGTQTGLYIIDPSNPGENGSNKRLLSDLPARGLHNVEWNPDPEREQVLLFFKFPVANSRGVVMRGVFLVDIDRMGPNPLADQSFITQLHALTDIHTLWFSPNGTHITWASSRGIWYRKSDEPDAEVFQLTAESSEGRSLPIRGVEWNHSETKLCFTAGPNVYIHDLELLAERERLRLMAEQAQRNGAQIPQEAEGWEEIEPTILIATLNGNFVAEPSWIDDDHVFVSSFEDVGLEMRDRRNRPDLSIEARQMPDADEEEDGENPDDEDE